MNTPRWVTPRRLGAAAAVYGVFVAGWYLGQPVTPECHVDQAALDRIAEEHEEEQAVEPPPAPSPTPSATAFPTYGTLEDDARSSMSLTFTTYAVACTNDTSERPRLGAWLEGRLQ
ncbi:hypothetical protein [Streptomyces sp. DH41]|uniref:hypothetical protein n=1 Tax=Streptomyces sp. DH41 TaxID=3040125 RepID=UPI0024430C7D|nr:hypothetical protein [Streptomyces sp. DH41]MDG9728113.1 hypothetical protein [Streptomyces sp. DH41]